MDKKRIAKKIVSQAYVRRNTNDDVQELTVPVITGDRLDVAKEKINVLFQEASKSSRQLVKSRFSPMFNRSDAFAGA
ncbi:MAG: hypothetical protein H0W88_02100 [Parachlamydiaceae bacterium]|nr:hypothetical protein [Parachlamydiaceae bacterium]